MVKNNQEFAEFLRDEVDLNKSRLDRLETAVGGVNGYLKEHLTGYQKMERQGSYALDTLIKPVDDNDEYDADIQIVMNPTPRWEPKDYVLAINRTLAGNKTYADKLRLKTRCVTVDYAGDFHLDTVPRVTSGGKHYVCNRHDNKFEETDGNGYREWFNGKNHITGGNLKKVVKLLKYLRDHKNSFTAKSILLTTLAGDMIRESDKGTAAVSTVADTLETVLSRMDNYLQQHPNMPEIKNPVLPTENFNRHWEQLRYANFRDRIQSYAHTAQQAQAEASADKAIKLWQDLFGDKFGKSSSGGSGNGGGGSNSSPQRPANGNGGGGTATRVAAPAITAVRPIRPYASTQAMLSRDPETVTIRVSADDIQKLNQEQPGLSYDSENHRIVGTLEVSAEYDHSDGLLKTVGLPLGQGGQKFMQDAFEIEIRLKFKPGDNPWPHVIETEGRIQQIMEKHQITEIADMHCYSDQPENHCCLGINAATTFQIDLASFARDIIVPFFYRVAYVDKHGLQAARKDLWGERPHDRKEATREYLAEMEDMRRADRNRPCPCGSGRKYKRCHREEAESALRWRGK